MKTWRLSSSFSRTDSPPLPVTLRTQGGASRHVGGANRTIIKLAQQLLIGPAVNLASHPLGELARLDQAYDLVENNIGSEIRAKIAAREKHLAA